MPSCKSLCKVTSVKSSYFTIRRQDTRTWIQHETFLGPTQSNRFLHFVWLLFPNHHANQTSVQLPIIRHKKHKMQFFIQTTELKASYLQSSKQLAAVLYPRNVKQLIDGSMGKLRAKLCVSLNGIQDLVFILGPTHLEQNIFESGAGPNGTNEELDIFNAGSIL